MRYEIYIICVVLLTSCDLEIIPDETAAPDSTFVSSFGGDNPDAGQSVVQLSGGHYIVGGYGDSRIVKLDPLSGQIIKSLNPNAYSLWVEKVFVNRQDEIYVVGFAQTEENNMSVSRGVILRIDDELNIQEEIFGTRQGTLNDIDWYFNILQAPNGRYNVLSIRREDGVSGFSIGTAFLPFTDPPVANSFLTSFRTTYRVFLRTADGKFLVVGNDQVSGDAHLLRVSTNRSEIDASFPVGELIIGEVLINPEGNYLMVGELDDLPHLSVIRPDGSMVFSSSMMNEVGFCRDVIAVPDGYVVMGDVEVGPNGGRDVFLMHLDENYNQVWLKFYGGAFDEFGAELIVTQDGGYLFTGGSKSFGSGNNDYFFVKTDRNGDVN